MSDDYPFPIDSLPTIDATDDEAANYEQTVIQLLNDWIAQRGAAPRSQRADYCRAASKVPGQTADSSSTSDHMPTANTTPIGRYGMTTPL